MTITFALAAGCVEAPRPGPEPPMWRAVTGERAVFVPLLLGPATPVGGRGAAVPHEYAATGCADARRLGVAWLYDWSAQPPQCDDVVSVPMVWGQFNTKACPVLGPGPFVLGFNEPDRPDQANMMPAEAAQLWQRLTVECYPGRDFATPAVPLGRFYTAGLDWLVDWVAAYEQLYGAAPRARYMAVHCFTWDDADGAAMCRQRLGEAEAWARASGLAGLIVSEWAMLPGPDFTPAQAIAQAEELIRWMDSNSYIIGHAWTSTRILGDEKWWFGAARNTALFDFVSGELTAFGVWYRER